MKIFFAIFFLINFLGLGFIAFAKTDFDQNIVQIPNTIDEAKQMGEGMLPLIPGIIKGLWNDGTKVLKSLFDFSNDQWNKNIFPVVNKYFGEIIRKRSPIIKQEFEKESTEMKEDIKSEMPKITKGLWDTIKEILK